MNNKFMQLVALAKKQKGLNKTQFINESKLSASQAHKLTNKPEAIYTCRQPTRDKMASVIGIDVKYLDDKDIPTEDFSKYLSAAAASEKPADKPSGAKTVSSKKTTSTKKTAPAKKTASSKAAAEKKSVAPKASPAKKAAPAKKTATQNTTADMKPNASKAAPAKKPAVKKPAPAKKPAAKKPAPAKKPAAKKPAPAKKPAANKTAVRLNKHLNLMSKLGEALEEYTTQGGTVGEFTQTLKQFADLVD